MVNRLSHALTLVELMVAMTLLSIISMICYATLQMAFALWDRGNVAQETLRQGQIALGQIVLDLRCAYIQRGMGGSDSSASAASEEKSGDKKKNPKKKLYFRGVAGIVRGKAADGIHFIRPGNKGLAEVRYFLKENEVGEEPAHELLRRYHPVAEGDVAAMEPEAGEAVTVLLQNVREFSFRYLAENNQWVTTWPTTDEKTATTLPKAVSISLVLWLPNAHQEFSLPVVIVKLPLGGKDYSSKDKDKK